ncbi:hypothetical protein ACFLRN_00395 [Thermoproteota archaeon]
MNGDCCCGSDCQDYGHGSRKVLTKTERIEKLKNYAEELKKELVAVEENIKELSK